VSKAKQDLLVLQSKKHFIAPKVVKKALNPKNLNLDEESE
jgi:hypothetical protein